MLRVMTKSINIRMLPINSKGLMVKRVRASLESSSKRGSFDRISSCQEFQNFENWKWEIENIFCIVCELKESENHLSTSFIKMGGGGWVVGAL